MSKRKNNKNIKAFTIVEVLATLAIISIVFVIGFTVYNNIIKKSKDTTSTVFVNNLKEAAQLYSKENVKDKDWVIKYTDYTKVGDYTCITTNDLINSGYFNEKQLNDENENIKKNNITKDTFILINRDKNKTVSSVEIKSGAKTKEECLQSNLTLTKTLESYSDTIIIKKEEEASATTYYCTIEDCGQKVEFNNNQCELTGLTQDTQYKVNILKEENNSTVTGEEISASTRKIKTPNIEVTNTDTMIDNMLTNKGTIIYYDDNIKPGNEYFYFKADKKLTIEEHTDYEIYSCDQNTFNDNSCQKTNPITTNIEPNTYYYVVFGNDNSSKKITLSLKSNFNDNATITAYTKDRSKNSKDKTATINNDINKVSNKIYTINLNNQGTTVGKIYETYGKSFSLEPNNKVMTSTANKVDIPSKVGYKFLGYFTESYSSVNGTTIDYSKQYINENGYLTANADNKYFTNTGTLYAVWERTFKCENVGATTKYNNQDYYTANKDSDYCYIALDTVSSSSGTYSEAANKLYSEYFTSGSEIKKEVDTGLVTILGTYTSGTGISSKSIIWSGSSSALILNQKLNYYAISSNSYYYGAHHDSQNHNYSSPPTKSVNSSYSTGTKTKCDSISGASCVITNGKLNTGTANVSSYFTTFYSSNRSDSEFKLNVKDTTRTDTRSRTITTRVYTKDCGGTFHNANRFILRPKGTAAVYCWNYNTEAGRKWNPCEDVDRWYSAGTATGKLNDSDYVVFNFSTGGNCGVTKYSLSDASYPINYRLYLKVKYT